MALTSRVAKDDPALLVLLPSRVLGLGGLCHHAQFPRCWELSLCVLGQLCHLDYFLTPPDVPVSHHVIGAGKTELLSILDDDGLFKK